MVKIVFFKLSEGDWQNSVDQNWVLDSSPRMCLYKK